MRNIKGQSMFEVVLALFIITMIIVGIVSISTKSISNSLFSRSKTQAERYSQEGIEWVRTEREKNSTTFNAYANTANYCLVNLSFSIDSACGSSQYVTGSANFKRQLTFVKNTVAGKTIITATVITSWQDSKGIHEARAVTDFSDIRQI